MKKKHIIALVVGIIILLGIVIGIVIVSRENDDADKDYKVHETNDDTVEKESENGLKESDSEDGPVSNEDIVIDFNGETSDDNTTNDKGNETEVTTDKDSNNEDDLETPEKPEAPETQETGKWGTFY